MPSTMPSSSTTASAAATSSASSSGGGGGGGTSTISATTATSSSTDTAATGSSGISLQHRCSHDAQPVFIVASCPVCLNDACEAPMVALKCGHVVCRDDFIGIGGKMGQD